MLESPTFRPVPMLGRLIAGLAFARSAELVR